MRFIAFAALIASATALKVESENEYNIWWEVAPPPKKLFEVVKRGEHDFQDLNVEKAMNANPNNAGTWPVPDAPPAFKKPKS